MRLNLDTWIVNQLNQSCDSLEGAFLPLPVIFSSETYFLLTIMKIHPDSYFIQPEEIQKGWVSFDGI